MTDWPHNPDYERAMDLLELRRWAEAEPLLRRARVAQPDRPRVHANLARALEHQERLDEALASAEEAVRLGPDDDYCWWTLALVRITRDELEAGYAAAKAAADCAPDDADRARALSDAGRAATLLERPRQGLAHATEAVRLNPHDADYWHVRAITLAKLGRWGEAARDVREALGRDALNPDFEASRRTIDQGVATLRQILPDARRRAASEDSADAWQGLAELLVRLGELEEAIAAFDEARRRSPEAPLEDGALLSPWEADARIALLEA
jgi:tetratricopeptide (TPR) repeat protein